MSYKNYFKNIGKKIIACPSCKQQLRIPVRPGKRLRITCSKCKTEFEIYFQSPLQDFFKWQKGRGLGFNLKSYWYRFAALPSRAQFTIIIIFVLFITMISSLFYLPKEKVYPLKEKIEFNPEVDYQGPEV